MGFFFVYVIERISVILSAIKSVALIYLCPMLYIYIYTNKYHNIACGQRFRFVLKCLNYKLFSY